MATRILFLPGLDGLKNSAENIQECLKDIEVVPFMYPTGQALGWESLCALVESKLLALDTNLLAGESFGGAVALKTAIRFPQSVRGLCLLGAFIEEPPPFAARLGCVANKVLPDLLLKPVARMLVAWKLAGNLTGEKRKRFLSRFEGLDHGELARRLKLLSNYSVSDRLTDIQATTEVIFGSQDVLARGQAQLDTWKRIPDVQLHQLDGYGHVVCAEVPIEVARRIETWVARAGAKHDPQ